MSFQLETLRLYLREMTWEDYPALCRILQDGQAAYVCNSAPAVKPLDRTVDGRQFPIKINGARQKA